jgi:hypothetical protein
LIDVGAYARLMAELASAGAARRAGVLEEHGLDEAGWSEIDRTWQAALSEALDPPGGVEAEGHVPAILSAYATAYEARQRELAAPVSLERFAEVTRLFGANGDIQAALARTQMKMSDFAAASAHWSRAMIEDPEIEARFAALLARRGV